LAREGERGQSTKNWIKEKVRKVLEGSWLGEGVRGSFVQALGTGPDLECLDIRKKRKRHKDLAHRPLKPGGHSCEERKRGVVIGG